MDLASLTYEELQDRYLDMALYRDGCAMRRETAEFERISAEMLVMRRELARRAQQARLARAKDI